MTSPSTENFLTMREVSLGYRGAAVLRNVSVVVQQGDFIAIVGPNGSGKSTLLRGMVGLIAPLAGSVTYTIDPRKQPIGFVPQSERLERSFPLSALDVVSMGGYFGASATFLSRRLLRDRAHGALECVGMGDHGNALFGEMSGGQRQRVLIARALIADATALFMDEPTTGIDPGGEDLIVRLLCDLQRQRKLTIVMVSHALALVQSVVPTVIVVADGKVRRGPTAALLTQERFTELYS